MQDGGHLEYLDVRKYRSCPATASGELQLGTPGAPAVEACVGVKVVGGAR